MDMSETPKSPSAKPRAGISDSRKKLAEAVAAEEKETTDRCWKRILPILEEEGCGLVAFPSFTPDGRVEAYPVLQYMREP